MNDDSIGRMTNPFELLGDRLQTQSASDIAREIGVSRQYLHQVAKGHRPMGPKILDWLGIERSVTYRKINGTATKTNGRKASAGR